VIQARKGVAVFNLAEDNESFSEVLSKLLPHPLGPIELHTAVNVIAVISTHLHCEVSNSVYHISWVRIAWIPWDSLEVRQVVIQDMQYNLPRWGCTVIGYIIKSLGSVTTTVRKSIKGWKANSSPVLMMTSTRKM
jgi:hypothetical protein